jgi:hypothetical protein
MKLQIIETSDYILAVSDEEIKEGDWYWTPIKRSIEQCVKKLLIIKEGDNDVEQLKLIAYQPKGNVSELDLPLLPELFIEDDVEKLAKEHLQFWRNKNNIHLSNIVHADRCKNDFKAGYKAATKVYSEEDLINAYKQGLNDSDNIRLFGEEQIIKDFVKSLEKPRIPKYFIPTLVEKRIKNPHTCEHYNEVGCIKDICSCYSLTPDTLVNHQNKTVLIGTYE